MLNLLFKGINKKILLKTYSLYLNSENTILKRELEKSNKIVQLYKKVNYGDNKGTPQSGRKKNLTKNLRETPNSIKNSAIENSKEECFEANNIQVNLTNKDDKTLQMSMSQTPKKRHEENDLQLKEETSYNRKKKIIILADQQGKKLQQTLQRLIGSEYQVTCTWKAGAKLKTILSTSDKELENLDKNDYIVILGGINDRNPYEIQSCLHLWLDKFNKTNIIICEVPRNQNLIEKKLNYQLKFLCSMYQHVCFIDLNFSRFIPKQKHYALYTCRMILKDILRIGYLSKYEMYTNAIKNRNELKNNIIYVVRVLKQTISSYIKTITF